jgi:hypothetical protein
MYTLIETAKAFMDLENEDYAMAMAVRMLVEQLVGETW